MSDDDGFPPLPMNTPPNRERRNYSDSSTNSSELDRIPAPPSLHLEEIPIPMETDMEIPLPVDTPSRYSPTHALDDEEISSPSEKKSVLGLSLAKRRLMAFSSAKAAQQASPSSTTKKLSPLKPTQKPKQEPVLAIQTIKEEETQLKKMLAMNTILADKLNQVKMIASVGSTTFPSTLQTAIVKPLVVQKVIPVSDPIVDSSVQDDEPRASGSKTVKKSSKRKSRSRSKSPQKKSSSNTRKRSRKSRSRSPSKEKTKKKVVRRSKSLSPVDRKRDEKQRRSKSKSPDSRQKDKKITRMSPPPSRKTEKRGDRDRERDKEGKKKEEVTSRSSRSRRESGSSKDKDTSKLSKVVPAPIKPRRNSTYDKIRKSRMPVNWLEYKQFEYEPEDIQLLWDDLKKKFSKERSRSRSSSCSPVRSNIEQPTKLSKSLNYPAGKLHKVNLIHGLDGDYPDHLIKWTKHFPRLPYGVNPLSANGYYKTRKDIFAEEDPEIIENMIEIIEQNPLHESATPIVTERHWCVSSEQAFCPSQGSSGILMSHLYSEDEESKSPFPVTKDAETLLPPPKSQESENGSSLSVDSTPSPLLKKKYEEKQEEPPSTLVIQKPKQRPQSPSDETEEEVEVKPKKKLKKKNRKYSGDGSDVPKIKKRKKKRGKKKYKSSSDEEEDSEEERRERKKKKKKAKKRRNRSKSDSSDSDDDDDPKPPGGGGAGSGSNKGNDVHRSEKSRKRKDSGNNEEKKSRKHKGDKVRKRDFIIDPQELMDGFNEESSDIKNEVVTTGTDDAVKLKDDAMEILSSLQEDEFFHMWLQKQDDNCSLSEFLRLGLGGSAEVEYAKSEEEKSEVVPDSIIPSTTLQEEPHSESEAVVAIQQEEKEVKETDIRTIGEIVEERNHRSRSRSTGREIERSRSRSTERDRSRSRSLERDRDRRRNRSYDYDRKRDRREYIDRRSDHRAYDDDYYNHHSRRHHGDSHRRYRKRHYYSSRYRDRSSRSRSSSPERVSRHYEHERRRSRSRSPDRIRRSTSPSVQLHVADSTISDADLISPVPAPPMPSGPGFIGGISKDILLSASANYFNPDNFSKDTPVESTPNFAEARPSSPRRLSLDERLELEMGIKMKEDMPKHAMAPHYFHPGQHQHLQEPQPSHFPLYQYPTTPQPPPFQKPIRHQTQITRVGNMIQVVPAEMPSAPITITCNSFITDFRGTHDNSPFRKRVVTIKVPIVPFFVPVVEAVLESEEVDNEKEELRRLKRLRKKQRAEKRKELREKQNKAETEIITEAVVVSSENTPECEVSTESITEDVGPAEKIGVEISSAKNITESVDLAEKIEDVVKASTENTAECVVSTDSITEDVCPAEKIGVEISSAEAITEESVDLAEKMEDIAVAPTENIADSSVAVEDIVMQDAASEEIKPEDEVTVVINAEKISAETSPEAIVSEEIQNKPSLPPAGAGILVPYGLRNSKGAKKSVKFADGVLPGYGSSPSGSECMMSPPPPPFYPYKKSFTLEKNGIQKKKKMSKKKKKKEITDIQIPPPSPAMPYPFCSIGILYQVCPQYAMLYAQSMAEKGYDIVFEPSTDAPYEEDKQVQCVGEKIEDDILHHISTPEQTQPQPIQTKISPIPTIISSTRNTKEIEFSSQTTLPRNCSPTGSNPNLLVVLSSSNKGKSELIKEETNLKISAIDENVKQNSSICIPLSKIAAAKRSNGTFRSPSPIRNYTNQFHQPRSSYEFTNHWNALPNLSPKSGINHQQPPPPSSAFRNENNFAVPIQTQSPPPPPPPLIESKFVRTNNITIVPTEVSMATAIPTLVSDVQSNYKDLSMV